MPQSLGFLVVFSINAKFILSRTSLEVWVTDLKFGCLLIIKYYKKKIKKKRRSKIMVTLWESTLEAKFFVFNLLSLLKIMQSS